MIHALSWLVVFGLLALWSLTAWALHAVAVWAVGNAGALTGAVAGAASIRLPDWLAPWVPADVVQTLTAWVSALAPAVDSVLQAAPALAGGLTVLTWVLWGLGSLLLLALGVGLHLLMAMWRRRGGGSGSQPQPQAAG